MLHFKYIKFRFCREYVYNRLFISFIEQALYFVPKKFLKTHFNPLLHESKVRAGKRTVVFGSHLFVNSVTISRKRVDPVNHKLYIVQDYYTLYKTIIHYTRLLYIIQDYYTQSHYTSLEKSNTLKTKLTWRGFRYHSIRTIFFDHKQYLTTYETYLYSI